MGITVTLVVVVLGFGGNTRRKKIGVDVLAQEHLRSGAKMLAGKGWLRSAANRDKETVKYNGGQLVPLDCAAKLNRGMDLHMAMACGQHQPRMQWLAGVPALLPPQRNLGASSAAMLQGYIGYFNPGNQASCSKLEPEQPVNDPGQSSNLPPQLRPQYPYHHSHGLNFLGERKLEPGGEVIQESRVGLQAHGLEPPRPGFDAGSQTWASTSAACGVTMFDAQPYTQVSRYGRILKLVDV
ncbi:hypothetical protein KSP40_PGU006471 [Platanthera guangdongensis]|uniref:Uncharacterized protein n=1 Tax=Platanthera guangdongensis TaxID=2320717 RepID=A0ABR2LSD3_9ASPA